MKHNRNPLAKAVSYALGAGMVAGLAVTASPVAAQDDEAADLERFEVIGSRISRADIEGALPVTVIDRESIEFSGRTSVADLLRETTFNSFGSFRPQSGSSAQSWAGLNLRGIGSSRTLILIDGRRAPIAPNVGSAQDLNAIPLAAVERIEILSDGASAIYGTDAIGGVVNVVTRADFEGAEIMYGVGSPQWEGGDTTEASAIFGASGDRGRIIAGVSMNERDIVFQNERPWSTGGASVFSNNWNRFGSFLGDWYVNDTHGASVPGDGCTGPAFEVSGGFCFYDFTAQAADEASIKNTSLFARGSYDINNDWSAYMTASVSRVESFGRYAPVPSSPFPGGLPTAFPGDPNHPATPPEAGGLNPVWDDFQDIADEPIWFAHRFAALGPRDSNSDANVYDMNIGIEGRVGDWDLDAGYRHAESKFLELGRNYVVGGLAQQAINSGAYNIYDPFSIEDDVANGMIATISRDSTFKYRELYAMASTDLFDMAAGPVGFAGGIEYRDEIYADLYDSLSEGGQVVGSAGNSAAGDRDVTAMFFELLFPLMDNLEMSLAGRYDDYSDYGSDFSPKIAFRYQPMDEITLRASYGEGFSAPTLDILTTQPSFSAASVVHAPTAEVLGVDPGDAIQVTTYVIANPDLESENSEQFSAGIAFEPLDWLNGSLDYYHIKIDGTISGVGIGTIVACIEGRIQNCPPGLSTFDANQPFPNEELGLGVAFGTQGNIAWGQTGFTNLGEIKTDGLDLNLRTNFDLAEFGRLNNELQVSYVNSYKIDGGDNFVGEVGSPRFRAQLSNQWSWGDFGVAWNINHIDGQDGTLASDEVDTPSWTTHNVQGNWYAPWGGRVTAGVTNVVGKEPPVDFGYGRGFNWNLYDGYGRVTYLRYTQSF